MKKSIIIILLLIILSPAVSAEIDTEVMDEVISIFNHHGSPMLLIDQQTGGIIFANDAARNFYGYTESEILSMNISEINTLTEEEVNEEWQLIEKHPKVGYEIASASKEFAIIAEEILAHHEKWDGTGYPNGLKNEEIPYLARIISVIDAYDVMTNDRPYSKAISKEKALKEIKACAGSQFDPEIANEFIEMLT